MSKIPSDEINALLRESDDARLVAADYLEETGEAAVAAAVRDHWRLVEWIAKRIDKAVTFDVRVDAYSEPLVICRRPFEHTLLGAAVITATCLDKQIPATHTICCWSLPPQFSDGTSTVPNPVLNRSYDRATLHLLDHVVLLAFQVADMSPTSSRMSEVSQ